MMDLDNTDPKDAPMDRCATCKHFSTADEGWTAPFGTCTRIMGTGELEDAKEEWLSEHETNRTESGMWGDGKWLSVARPDDLAYTSDASGYASSLHVRPEFGCVLHEPGEREPT